MPPSLDPQAADMAIDTDTGDMDTGSELVKSARTAVRRKAERGEYRREIAYAILDEGLFCHVGFCDAGTPVVLPMAYARIGDALYLHGATGNRMLRQLAAGAELCITVTLVDALVLARSAFHHSMNYRSVMLLGAAARVEDEDEKRAAMAALLDHMAPGRSRDARSPTAKELRATSMVRIAIAEGSAKVRTGGPIEEPEDLDAAIWAGQIPLSVMAGVGVADDGLPPETHVPSYVRDYPPRRVPGPSGDR
jgi:uncharacterized protein